MGDQEVPVDVLAVAHTVPTIEETHEYTLHNLQRLLQERCINVSPRAFESMQKAIQYISHAVNTEAVLVSADDFVATLARLVQLRTPETTDDIVRVLVRLLIIMRTLDET